MSRRLGTTEVQRLLSLMEQQLLQLRQTGWVNVVDGKPLLVGSHRKDPDCAWGRAGRTYAKGYKLHAVYGSVPLPMAWEIAPLNASEPEVAARLVPTLNGGGYILGDKAYDSNPLHDVALHTGHQLVAERKRPRTNLEHRQHSPGRLRSMALLRTDFGKALYRRRVDIERCFGWLTNHAGGLSPLPNWVRRAHRLHCGVQAKLIIHAIYGYLYHSPPVLAVE
jgi:Transposase DDE domain